MRSRILHIVCLGLVSSGIVGCISTPQTKALITPVGAIGYHTFEPPGARPPTPSEIDRMVAGLRHTPPERTN